GIGGSEQKSYLTRVWNESYSIDSFAGAAKLIGAPMTTRSSKSFYGRWTGKIENIPELPKLTDDGLVLRGSILNPFDAPIYSAFIIFQGGAYSLGTLAPGVTEIERGLTRLEPMRILNEHRSSIPSAKQGVWSVTSYNNSSKRLPYIFRAASFYDFGGGEDNFGIGKRMQRDIDLSELLRCNRAVIFGTIVDAHTDEYIETNELARRSVDALHDERLNRKIAEQKGEKIERAMDKAIEKYGLNGSTESFIPTETNWRSVVYSKTGNANERTVVVRMIVPLSRGAEKE
ncbi:MAG: hypothetical protein IKX88_08895, partial [Thermoguttaceae bacterium]|nr:hypothetical protein [Thermoguttaceae bacterium]